MATKIPLALFLIVSIFFIIPFFFMVYGSIVPSYTSRAYTASFLVTAFTDQHTIPLLINTIEFGAGGALLSTLLGTVYAWFMERTDIPGKGILGLLALAPLTLPILIKAISWVLLFSPRIGIINIFFESILGTSAPIFNIFSMPGLIFVWGMSGLSFTYLLVAPVFRSMDSTLEESSTVTGAGPYTTLRRVTLPLIMPALLSSFLLWTIGGVENFDTPFVLGQQAGISTLATYVYNLVNGFQSSLAAAYGIIFLLMTILLVGLFIWMTRKSFRYVTLTGKAGQVTQRRLGPWKWPSCGLLVVILIFAFFLPTMMMVLVSLVPVYTVSPGHNPFQTFTLANYVKAFQVPQLRIALVNSFELTISAGILTTILGAVMSYVLVKSKTRGKKVLEFVSYLPVAFPGVVYSTALIWTFLIIPIFNTYLYGTIWVMLTALVVLWLPYSIRFLSSTLIQIADELEEAASVAGSKWSHRFTRITLPLLKPGLANSFLYVMISSFKELGAVILLSNATTVVFVIVILTTYEDSPNIPTVAALSTFMLLILLASALIVRIISRSRIRFN